MTAALALLCLAVPAPHALHDWFSRPPVPNRLLVVPFEGDAQRGMLLESLAGLAAAHCNEHGPGTLVWEDLDHADYRRWRDELVAAHGVESTRTTLEGALRDLCAKGVVDGYLLYRYDSGDRALFTPGECDESANVATALAGVLGGVVVSEDLEPLAKDCGLRLFLDCRGMTEEQCLDEYGGRFSTLGVGTADPKTRNARSLMIANKLFVSSGRGPAYERSIGRCGPDSPVIGWGIGGEDEQTIASSRKGLFQTATNWCHNLTVLSTERPGEEVPWERLAAREPGESARAPEKGKHYVCLTLTDGDNIQWLMGNFIGGSEGRWYYGNPRRGSVPFTWGLPVPGLLQLSPRTLTDVLATATPNDDFVMYSGGGYFYPDLYGTDRAEDCLALHTRRLRPVMERTGIRVLAFSFQDWDSDAALKACSTMARELPGLLGILAFQYYPYSAGEGRTVFVDGADGDRVPVVSCRYTVWAKTGRERDTTPGNVAEALGGLPVVGEQATEDCFSWVLVHAWSRFRKPGPGVAPDDEDDVPQEAESANTSRGYDPALWTARRLPPHVTPVTATEFLRLIRAGLAPGA